MIQLSPSAANEIRRLKSKQQPNVLFRLAVKPGGCSGWYYDMSFDEALKVGDKPESSASSGDAALVFPQKDESIFECYDIAIVIDAKSLKHVNQLTIDYSEDLMGGGFRFYNSRSHATCECGNSFSTTQ
ncbi:MAG: iron-sulfur cluster assembly accessory protein [Brasilonema octagenarum HA4186-MV1]|jgi:Fe-S cluster assembly iron-binding protein IscA|nr:iron-sulfur cluster assembly accessory protein [Brasilonema octagenarum HA4186-MV1]